MSTSTAFARKLDRWQAHARAAYQKHLDEIDEDEALRERIWDEDDLLLAAIRRAGQDDILIGDAINSYHTHLKQIAKRDNREL